MRLAIFGIQQTEIKSPSPRLVQSDRLRKEFARFFKFAVVRQHIGGRTTRTYVQIAGKFCRTELATYACESSQKVNLMAASRNWRACRCSQRTSFWNCST